MEFDIKHNGPIVVLSITGRFDAHYAPDIQSTLMEMIEAGKVTIVINLAGALFLDSSALAVLVQAMKRTRQNNGDVVLCCLQTPVRVIFELTRFDRAFDIVDSEEKAIAVFQNKTAAVN